SKVLARFGDWAKLGKSELVSRLNEVADILMVTAQALKWRLVALGKLTMALIRDIEGILLRNNGRSRNKVLPPPPFSRSFMEVMGKAIEAGLISKRRLARELAIGTQDLGDLFRAHQIQVPESL